MPSDAAGPVAPIVSPNVISWAAAPVTHANANARTTDKCRIMVLPSDERLVLLAESMEHLAAVLKPLAPEKTVGERHASPLRRERAIRATRSVGATHASPSISVSAAERGRGGASPLRSNEMLGQAMTPSAASASISVSG